MPVYLQSLYGAIAWCVRGSHCPCGCCFQRRRAAPGADCLVLLGEVGFSPQGRGVSKPGACCGRLPHTSESFPGCLSSRGPPAGLPLCRRTRGVPGLVESARRVQPGRWWRWLVRPPVHGSLPTSCWFCQDGLAGRWDSPGLPCAAGTSLLDSPSVSRLGGGKPQAWVA